MVLNYNFLNGKIMTHGEGAKSGEKLGYKRWVVDAEDKPNFIHTHTHAHICFPREREIHM